MEPQQTSFDTFSNWMLTRMGADMAACQEVPPPDLHRFFASLYEDMLVNPAAYSIPREPFVTFFARVNLTPEETGQHEDLKAARMRVRKVVFAYLEFIYNLGRLSGWTPDGLQISRSTFENLTRDLLKKTRNTGALDRLGFHFSPEDPVTISNHLFPAMPAALAAFSQACAGIKDFDVYLFRRCDLAVLNGKTGPDFNDGLRLVSPPFQASVRETDQRLLQMRFKREIFVDVHDMDYRIRYSKKGDQIVYWCRIQETFHPDLHHYLRWKLESEITPRLFTALNQAVPGLADEVFAGLKPCAHCYAGKCMDRKIVSWNGVTKEACQGSGWNQIGCEPDDYQKLWIVLQILDQCTAHK